MSESLRQLERWAVRDRVRLQVPESLFHEVMEAKNDFAKALCKDLNALAEIPDEYFAEVVSLWTRASGSDWREKSGALLAAQPSLANLRNLTTADCGGPDAAQFLSHRAEQKKTATTVKEELGKLGAAAFVAHETSSQRKSGRQKSNVPR